MSNRSTKPCTLFLIGVLLFACSCSDRHRSASKQKEAHLYLQCDPVSLDPRVGYDRRTQQIIREIFEGLTRIGSDGQPHLALAESVRVSDDGLLYTFRLRPSVWSNGHELVADDFVYAWKSSLDPKDSNARSDALFVIRNAQKARAGQCSLDDIGICALDKRTLEVTLEHPVPYFLELLANPVFSPLCRTIVEKNPQFASAQRFVCNGPFCIKERKMKSHIILERNPRYWDHDAVSLDRISFSIIEEPQTAYNMFIAGALDWHGDPCGSVSLETAARLYQQHRLHLHQAGASYQMLCRVNTPHLRSVKIRQAIAHAIDRQSLCDNILQSGEIPAFSLSPRVLSYIDAPPFDDNNAARAQALFAEGCEELAVPPSSFPSITISFWADPSVKPMMEAVQAQLIAALHIDVRLDPLDRGAYLQKVCTGEYEILMVLLNVWVHDPSSNLDLFKYEKTVINGTAWSDPEYTRLLDRAASTLDANERRDCFSKAERIIMDQLPVIPLCYQTLKYIKSPQLQGEAVSPVGIVELKCLAKME